MKIEQTAVINTTQMKLELKHLSVYLPYQLECLAFEDGEEIFQGTLYKLKTKYVKETSFPIGCKVKSKNYPEKYSTTQFCNYEHCKPILRPLASLFYDVEIQGKKFVPVELLDSDTYPVDYFDVEMNFYEYLENWANSKDKSYHINFLPFGFIQQLLEWHFDIFGLIDAKLGVDINCLYGEVLQPFLNRNTLIIKL